MLTKLNIEKAILGAIIYCDGYALVAHILSDKNFSSTENIKHREVFNAVSRLYPDRPIDLLTVSNELRVLYPEHPEAMQWVMDINNGVCSSSNIVYWAFILLQIDISEKYKKQLIQWRERRQSDFEHVEAATLQEVIEMITPEQDIFEIINKSVLYFGHMNMTVERDEANEFFKDTADRARKIQRVDSINIALKYLFMITQCSDNQVKHECEVFAKAIADMIVTGTTNSRYTEAANAIYK